MQYPQFTLPDRSRPDERDDTLEGALKPKKSPGIFRISAPPHTHRRSMSVHTCNMAESEEKSHIDTGEST